MNEMDNRRAAELVESMRAATHIGYTLAAAAMSAIHTAAPTAEQLHAMADSLGSQAIELRAYARHLEWGAKCAEDAIELQARAAECEASLAAFAQSTTYAVLSTARLPSKADVVARMEAGGLLHEARRLAANNDHDGHLRLG